MTVEMTVCGHILTVKLTAKLRGSSGNLHLRENGHRYKKKIYAKYLDNYNIYNNETFFFKNN